MSRSSAITPMNLQRLPVEAVARILSFLSYTDLASVSHTSRFFREVYHSFPELQYSFVLQTYGMVDVDPTLDIRYKLNELERRERAWRSLDLPRKVTVKVPHRTSHIYDLTGGVYLLGDCKNSLISRDTHSLRFFDLSTCAAGPGVREEAWPEMKVDTNIVDIGFGLNEFDLVAVVGIRPPRDGEQGSIIMSLRELSTGAPHPLARNPDIIVDTVSGYGGRLSITLEIVGPRLLLLLTWHRPVQRPLQQLHDKLLLFNWWEGTKVVAESTRPFKWNGFAFLSPDLILLPDNKHGLEIVRLPDVSKGYSGKCFDRILTFELPTLQPLCKVGAIQCRSEPNLMGAPHPSMVEGKSAFAQRMRRKSRPPVAPDPKKAIVLLQIYYREFNNEPHDLLMGQWGVLRHNVSLVVHRETLLELAGKFARKAPDSDSKRRDSMEVDEEEVSVLRVPWASWGNRARWEADDTHVSNWITTSAGQRYIGIDEDGYIVIKDFNPSTVRRVRAVQNVARTAFESEAGIEGPSLANIESAPSMQCSEEFRIRLVPEEESSTSSGSDVNLESPIDEGMFYHAPDSSSHSLPSPFSLSSPPSPPSPPSFPPSSDPSALSPSVPIPDEELDLGEDLTWRSMRVIEEYNETEETELVQLFNGECQSPLPCVEYVSRRKYEHHGLLMDEERIIGLRHDEHTGAIIEFDVFTL